MTTESDIVPNEGGAVFSDDREYRYRLWRYLQHPEQARLGGDDGGTVAFLMLNPSTADAEQDDPTVRRCRGYAEDWGFRELIVGNIFALRATDPDELYDHPNPVGVGDENDQALLEIADKADLTVAAWGTHGDHLNRAAFVADMLEWHGHELHALDTTKAGHPVHPLYQPADKEPEPFDYGD